jgi:hypothetical protein
VPGHDHLVRERYRVPELEEIAVRLDTMPAASSGGRWRGPYLGAEPETDPATCLPALVLKFRR